jgi:aminoglycoside 6'-N-acetyltransferase I
MIDVVPYNDSFKKQYVQVITMLWSDIKPDEIDQIIEEHKANKGYILLATQNKQVIGFINTQIRHDYVEGSDESKTGYIEGIFVKEAYRKQHIGKKLFHEIITYYKSIGIHTIGSDAFVDNHLSDAFHKAIGFEEVSINRHYIYKL